MTASGSLAGVGVGVIVAVAEEGSDEPGSPITPPVVHPESASVISEHAAIARALHHGVLIVSPACSGRSVGAAQSGYRPGARRHPHNTYRYFP